MPPLNDPLLRYALAGALGIAFLSSAFEKIRDTSRWRDAVHSYNLVPISITTPVAYAVLGAEALSGLLLLLPTMSAQGSWIAATVLTIVTGAVAVNLLRGRSNLDCGCGGLGVEQSISWSLVTRNVGLIACACAIVVPESGRPESTADLCLAVAAALGLAGLYAILNQIIATAPRLRTLRRRR